MKRAPSPAPSARAKATSSRPRDGTLFLDEIGDLSLFTQVKLLRVLQQMEFSRLGSNRLIPLRARLIFATHRDLAQAGRRRQIPPGSLLPHQRHAH